ncbi:MAG: LacI family DNA-binding transcriptional regulator [Acetivibrio sp.]
MVSLKEVAIACGLSLTQTSRALNNHKDVSEKTKQRVKETAEQLGYVKNINAQILATKESKQLAVMVYGMDKDKNAEQSITFNLIKGVNRYAKEKGYEAVVYFIEDENVSYLDFAIQRGINGIILFGVNYEDKNFKQIIASDFPCVVIDIPVDGEKKGSVVVNNLYYSMMATNCLIERGRKKIAMLCGHGQSMVDVERRAGYEMALKNNQRKVEENLIVLADFDTEKAYEKTRELMEKYPDIDGFFCASDSMALGAVNALKDKGYQVPEDVSIFGFDGIALGEYVTPSLSTIQQDNLKKGYAAAKLLYEILHGEKERENVVVPCDIILRESV